MSVMKSDRRPAVRGQRPKATTVFAAAFLAGAAAAVGVNRSLDVRLAQRQPRVESEPIFVALRSLPQGAAVTVWDVALRDWPKAMLPAAAMRPRDSFEGMVLRHPLREGQPILSVQLVKAAADTAQVAETAPAAALPSPTLETAPPQTDLWAPAEVPVPAGPPTEAVSHSQPAAEPVVTDPVVVAAPASTDVDPLLAQVTTAATSDPAPMRELVVRYLVVPERIALEADRSFLPAPESPLQHDVATGTTAEPTSALSAQAEEGSVRQGRAARPTERTSSTRDRQPQRPPRSATGRPVPARQPEKTSFLRSMMPGLSLGMGAVEPAATIPSSPGRDDEQAPRPKVRTFGLFR